MRPYAAGALDVVSGIRCRQQHLQAAGHVHPAAQVRGVEVSQSVLMVAKSLLSASAADTSVAIAPPDLICDGADPDPTPAGGPYPYSLL